MAEGVKTVNSKTEVLWFPTKEDFLSQAHDTIKTGDNILIKASHGMEFPELVDALKEF